LCQLTIENLGDRFLGADTMPRLRSTSFLAFLLAAIFTVTPAWSDDAATCRTWTGQEALAACTRMITSNTLRGADLAQAYVWRGITRGTQQR
jgi:hypothetical protein